MKEFIKNFRYNSGAYITLQSSNAYGRFITTIEYRGGGGRGLIIILEEIGSQGWKKMAEELSAMSGSVGKAIGKKSVREDPLTV